jgi:uncharacterized protein
VTHDGRLSQLVAVLDRHAELAIAVSGGVDSMVLAHVASDCSRTKATVVHAVSAAVPAEATARVREHAQRRGWALRLIDAGELSDPAYLGNPVDRCFHCKRNLYGHIHERVGLPIASGTNVDDLSDFRPGLEAARRFGVVHPYVEAGFDKRDIYALAGRLALDDLAELPAQPCLASRIETGIAVDAATLRFIEAAEKGLTEQLPGASSIRCRITANGVVFESAALPEGEERERVERWARSLCARQGRAFHGLRVYRRGAAFLRHTAP